VKVIAIAGWRPGIDPSARERRGTILRARTCALVAFPNCGRHRTAYAIAIDARAVVKEFTG